MRFAFFVALACLVPAASVSAATITFEGFENQIYGSPIDRLGFTIGNLAGDEQHFHEITSTGFSLPNNGTGVLLNDRDTRIFVNQGGTNFILTSIDVAAALGNSPAVGLTITGYLLGGSTGVITLESLGQGYTTLSGGALGTVDQIVFDGIAGQGGFVLDNLTLNEGEAAIPEPGTYAMMGLGLTALALLRRRA